VAVLVYPKANYATDARPTIRVAVLSDVGVACVGDTCVPGIINKPGKDYTISSDTRIRYGVDTDNIIDVRVFRFTSSVDVSHLNPSYVIGLYVDSDGRRHIIYGIGVSDVPLVDKVYIVGRDGRVFKCEPCTGAGDITYVGTVDDVVIGIEPELSGYPPMLVRPKLPVIVLALVIGAAAAVGAYTVKEYFRHKDTQYIVDRQIQFYESIVEDIKSGALELEEAVQVLESVHGIATVTYGPQGSDADSILSWLAENWKEVVAGIGALTTVLLVALKFSMIKDIISSLFKRE